MTVLKIMFTSFPSSYEYESRQCLGGILTLITVGVLSFLKGYFCMSIIFKEPGDMI